MSVTRSRDSNPRPSRRDFLKLATSGVLGLSGVLAAAGVFRYLDFTSDPAPQTEFNLGPAANYPPGSRSLVAEVPTMIVHSDNGLSALSLTCTHLGCTVEGTSDGFACPCHGSRYDENGNVLRGPAPRPLRRLRVEITADDDLVVHTD